MWNYLTYKTPCVLIELGQVQDPHDKVLLADTDRIANALARGVCRAFNVQFDIPAPTPIPEDKDKQIKELQQLVNTLKEQVEQAKKDGEAKVAVVIGECQKKTDDILGYAIEVESRIQNIKSLCKK